MSLMAQVKQFLYSFRGGGDVDGFAPRADHWRWLMVFLTPAFLYGCSIQDRLLYYPERHLPSDVEMKRHGMTYWPGREGYRGFAAEPSDGEPVGTVIVFHGNAATASDRWYYLDPLTKLGYRVVLAEYPGYGRRGGTLGEDSFVSDARETIRLAEDTYGSPLYLLGESLGAAVAAAAARDSGMAVDGLILVTPWDTLESVAKEKFPFLPVRLLMTDRYDTLSNLKKFRGKVAVLAAEQDDIIPPHHAQEVFRGFSGPKLFKAIRGAGHNDWPAMISDMMWVEIMQFLSVKK